ncbi:unnamed protein product [Acanthosepion pharaonis]|uniref:Uncharacterized protein n=1 Tax=Acanthosepion pharaonis TaxID=158019 RepID=A0A812CT37_ACAPH|nr:unnamed protein product [Sepia pharaonis]
MFSTTTKKFPIPFSNRFKKRRKRKKKRRISEISWGQNIEAVLVGVAAFIANTIIIGFIASLAIYYVEFKDAFSDSHGLISLSVFLPTGIFGSVGLLSGMFLNKFGVRITAITGSLLLAIGVGVCAYVPNVIFLFVFLGAFAGTGCSFVYLSVTMGLCSYFKLKGRLLMPLVTMVYSVVIMDFFDINHYAIAIGLSETVAGCGVVTIGYIIGFLTEYNNGSYMVSFYLIAAISVTCMLPMLILCLYKRRKVSVKNP